MTEVVDKYAPDERGFKDETQSGGLSFSTALTLLKNGVPVAREGWNGKGMFIYLNRGSANDSQKMHHRIDGISGSLFDRGDDGTGTRLPNINMRSSTGATVTGWLASQTDMLAEDWVMVTP